MAKVSEKTGAKTEREFELHIVSDGFYESLARTSQNKGVYIIQSGKHYKIGFTNHLIQRVEALQIGNPTPLEVIMWIMTSNPQELERILHKELHGVRGRGEWFELTDEQVGGIIQIAKRWWLESN